jgi:hypothetical protein
MIQQHLATVIPIGALINWIKFDKKGKDSQA